MLEEWAYERHSESETAQTEAFIEFLHTSNHHRGHSTLKGTPPMSRVKDLVGQYN